MDDAKSGGQPLKGKRSGTLPKAVIGISVSTRSGKKQSPGYEPTGKATSFRSKAEKPADKGRKATATLRLPATHHPGSKPLA